MREEDYEIVDEVPREPRVPLWMWITAGALIIVGLCVLPIGDVVIRIVG